MVEDLENEIHKLEKKTKEIEAELSTPKGATSPTLYKSHEELQQQITDKMIKWEKTILELERMKN
jgi:hypothetical protein